MVIVVGLSAMCSSDYLVQSQMTSARSINFDVNIHGLQKMTLLQRNHLAKYYTFFK